MQFLATLFGGNESSLLNAAFALGLVLVLLVLVLWGIKLVLGVSQGMPASRGRRLAIVESLQIDARHRVTIIRRDNVEHVVLTGGNQDIVLEAGLPVDRPSVRRPRPVAATAMPRGAAGSSASVSPPAGPKRGASKDSSTVVPDEPSPVQEPFMPRRSGPPPANETLKATVLGRPAVIPTFPQDGRIASDDSATSENDQHRGQSKLGASTSRFPGSTFKYEGH